MSANNPKKHKRIRYEVALRSVIGTRDEQQDCAYAYANGSVVFATVCDGMGGMQNGKTAGITAMGKMKELYFSKDEEESYPAFFLRSVDILDECVFTLKDGEGSRSSSGTTIVAIAIENDKLHWMSVGDSRLYILRKEEIVRVTRDHNYRLHLDRMMREQVITKAQYDGELPGAEVLISYIGIGGVQVMDINDAPFVLRPGDTVLLSSDGLYKALPDDEILRCLQSGGAEHAIDVLIGESGGKANRFRDNTTCVVVKCLDAEAES
jgi:protein phosphatase